VEKVNALTIDVEEHYHAHVLAVHRPPSDVTGSRVVGNTTRILDVLGELGVTATFFVLGRVAEREPELVRRIHRLGHEIACHGLSHALIYEQRREEFRSETFQAKQLLEDIIGSAVHGYRASTFSVRADSLWAMEVIAEAGFSYDSSIAPVRHDLYGLAKAPASPYRLAVSSDVSIIEIPVATVRMLGVRLMVGGGGYFRLLPYWFTRAALRSINGQKLPPFVVYLHPWEFDPDQPRVESLPLLSRVRHYTNLARTTTRFRQLLGDFSFSSVRNLLEGIERNCTTVMANTLL
jgi:polysaccharide deacetylase family protein (PEP-CTERM system associated)